jgi:O-antigen/teichoic acid export membrane protein
MHSTVEKTTLYLSQIAISGILMLILMPIISQYLTPGELGLFVLAQIYTGTAVGIANFGMLLSYERNFFIFEKSSEDSAKLISSAVAFVIFNLSILLTVVYLFQSEISSLIFPTSTPDNLLFFVLIGAAASSLSQYYLTFLKNSGLAKNYIKHMITNSVINFIVAIGFVTQSNFGAMSLVYAWIISNSILFILLFLILGRKLSVGFDQGMLKDMLKISLPLTPRVFFGFMNTQLDKILLSFIGSSGLVGVYHMGQTFAMTIFQFMTGLDRVFQPEVYRKLFSNKHIKESHEINNYILPFLYISIFMALIVAIFSREFVSLFLSNEYQEATPIIIILSIYYASLFFGKITGIQLIFAKKTHITTLLMFAGIAINVGLSIPFIMKWGIVGAAWATTISGVVMIVISYLAAQRYARISWQWKSVFSIYGIFLVATTFSIIDYNIPMHLGISLIIKLSIIFSYIVLGRMLSLVSLSEIRKFIHFKR